MKSFKGQKFQQIDRIITSWMADKGIMLLRISIGIIFLWFGVLKFFPGLSPAEGLAIDTIKLLTFGFVPEHIIIYGLASWDTLIGLGLVFKVFMRETLLLLYLQMLGTLSPIFLFPNEVFTHFPYALTLEGQYIFKNMVVISAGIVLGATVRGGKIVTETEDSE
jgi:uncharacterized membrane protein YkgB